MPRDSTFVVAWDGLKKKVVVPIKRQFGYVISTKRYDDRLREEVRNLESEARRVDTMAEEARINVRNFYYCFAEWRQSAHRALQEAGYLLEDISSKASKSCSCWSLAGPDYRYQFSRKAEGKIKVIRRLVQKCGEFKQLNDISFVDPAAAARREGGRAAPSTAAVSAVSAPSASTSIRIGDDGVFETRASIVQSIMEALADDSTSVVGVHGMGGVGKSTLLELEELERCSTDIESSPPEYSKKVLMRGGLGLTDPPEVTQWHSFTEIYLMENQLAELPENPWCPGLLVLFLNRNCKLRTIGLPFFDFMPALEILNLSRTRIKFLPESLFGLSRLKRLFLNHCELLRVLPPKIGELQQLEVLDLEGTEIMHLPKEVAKLTKLTCLEVSFCPRVNRGTKSAEANALIPQGTISALSQLEELSIDIHPEDNGWESVVEAIVDDVCGLMRLDTLKLYFPQVEHLRKWFGTSKVSRSLSHFKFVVGKHAERFMYYLPEDLEFELDHWDRSLKYVNGVGVPIDIQKILRHTSAFFLDRHWDVTKLSDFGSENMEQLKCCIIGESREIQVIIDGTDMYDEADRSEIVLESWENDKRFLGSLEYLYAYHMKSLRSIYEGPINRGCLSHLKCLALLTCPRLTSIFTPGLLENLDSLEELNVKDCPLVSSLVRCEDTSIYESTYFLPKLKKISLVSLPELISISDGLCIAPNLERLSIIDCPKFESPSADEICCSHLTGAKAQSIPKSK